MKAIFNEIKRCAIIQNQFNEESWLKALRDILNTTYTDENIRIRLINLASLAISAIEHYDCRIKTDEELTEELLHHISRLIGKVDNNIVYEAITKYLSKQLTLNDCVNRLKVL